MATDSNTPYVPDADEIEQQAVGDSDGDDLSPRGEHRGDSAFVISRSGRFTTDGRRRSWRSGLDESAADIEPVPAAAKEEYRRYFLEFALTQSALRTFDDLVLEPDWEVTAKINDEVDEEMTEALNLWGQNCTVRAGEPGHDLNNILAQCPSGRRAKPAVLIEKIGTVDDPDAIAGLQLLEPWEMSARLVPNQNLIIQPGHEVGRDHPTVERDGEEVPAAYVQYDEAHSTFASSDKDAIPFAQDDLLKLTHEPPDGSAWGRTIWSALAEPIDRLKQKLRDRDAAIRLTGHPHRIYSSETWSKDEAQAYADAHDAGDMSAWDLEEEANKKSYAGRVDYVPETVSVQVVEGNVADISGAIKDDLEQIFSILPVSKHNIAYVDEINQFVVEPLDANDDRKVDKERRYLESAFTPLFEDKADELANADEYEGEVEFHIRQPESDNPLERSDFDPERVAKLIDAFTEWVKSGASAEFPRELPYFLSGMSREDFEGEFGEEDRDRPMDTSEPDATDTEGEEAAEGEEEDIDEEDPNVQEAAEQMNLVRSEGS